MTSTGSQHDPGDRIRGDQAVQTAQAPDRSGLGSVAVDTTSLSPDGSASVIRTAIDWP